MSRNFQYKARPVPAKKSTKKRSSHVIYDSSDDNYDGVNDISDSEEDEADVTKVEEQAILESEQDDDEADTPRPTQDDEESSWEGFDGDSQSVLGDNVPFFDDHMARTQDADFDTATWAAASSLASDDERVRKVRFDLSDSDDEEEDENNFGFPDIFVPQSELATSFRRQIEQDQGSEDSFWDHNERAAPAVKEDAGSSSDSSSSSSLSYDSDDDGETTDEDLDLISRCVPTRSVLRRPSTDSGSEEEINPVRTPIRPARGPRLGIWKSTPGKPFVIMDDKKKILKVFGQTPISRRHTIAEDTRSNLNSPQPSASQPMLEMSPMISNSANLMMSAMYAPMDQFAGNVLGPPEAFFPFTSISSNGEMTQDSTSSYDDDDVDDENLWKLDDFLHFGPDSSDDEAAHDDNGETSSTLEGEISTPRPATANSEDHYNPLLSNPALVGAFRSNQHRHKILSRNSNTTENSLLFSTSINSAAIRGIKKGRISAATAPIATPRKRAPRPDLSSPSTAQGQKRKFSGETMGHKRTKSLN